MKKITYQAVLEKTRNKKCTIYSDVYDHPQDFFIVNTLSFGLITLNSDDKFYLMKDGQIEFKSLDDGDGFIKIH